MMEKTFGYKAITKEEILDYLRELKPQLEKVGITKLGLFGSYAKDEATLSSDIDIVIEEDMEIFLQNFTAIKSLLFLEELKHKIQRHFKVNIDICDTTTMEISKKNTLLEGVIYV